MSAGARDSDSLQPYVGFAVSEQFITAGGTQITPEARLSYSREMLDSGRVLPVNAFDGTPFVVRGVRTSRDMLAAGIGLSVRARDNMILYGNYDSVLPTGNVTQHILSAGLRMRF